MSQPKIVQKSFINSTSYHTMYLNLGLVAISEGAPRSGFEPKMRARNRKQDSYNLT